jgi:hypothetical protein
MQVVKVVENILTYKPFFKDWQGPKPVPVDFPDQIQDHRIASILEAIYSSYASQYGKPRWGDKTPLYLSHVDMLADLFPTAQFIHIIRDGRDVALSMREAYRGPRFWYVDLYYSAEEWKQKLRKAFSSGTHLGKSRYIEVRYEALVENPEPILRQVCAFLGEEYEPGMANPQQEAAHHYHTKGIHRQTRQPPTKGRSERWRKEMSMADQRLFERAAGTMLKLLGYPTQTVGSMTGYDLGRYALLKLKYHLVETGKQMVHSLGVFHPTKLLVRARKSIFKKPAMKKSLL